MKIYTVSDMYTHVGAISELRYSNSGSDYVYEIDEDGTNIFRITGKGLTIYSIVVRGKDILDEPESFKTEASFCIYLLKQLLKVNDG